MPIQSQLPPTPMINTGSQHHPGSWPGKDKLLHPASEDELFKNNWPNPSNISTLLFMKQQQQQQNTVSEKNVTKQKVSAHHLGVKEALSFTDLHCRFAAKNFGLPERSTMTPRTGTHLSAWPPGRAVPAGALALHTLQELRMFANTVARLPGRVLPESSLRAPEPRWPSVTRSPVPPPRPREGTSVTAGLHWD